MYTFHLNVAITIVNIYQQGLLCAEVHHRFFTGITSLVFLGMYELDNNNIRILEVRILKHREIKQIAQDHLPNKSVRI